MLLKKKGNIIIAYAENEMDIKDTNVTIGQEMGRISLKTGKFWGIVKCMQMLVEYMNLIKKKTKLTLTIEKK